jgi:hypothetical protein
MSFEMSEQQTYKESRFYIGWMTGTLIYNNFLSPSRVMTDERQL